MIGTVIGNYRILEKLGEGGMGAVYKGMDLMLEREVAIKVLRSELTSQPELAERFRSEAVALAKINHPNVATLHTFFRHGDQFFMVMEFVRGETIEDLLQKYGGMPFDRAVGMFRQALEGIGQAHALGIIHRDIKPANMMLTPSGLLKVMDFGIARVLGTSRMTREGSIIGTIQYMSPEAIQGFDVDARSDIYSLGVLLYEMVTGRVPFVSDTEFKIMMSHIQEPPLPPRAVMPALPVAIEQAIMRALVKLPDARFQTVAQFAQALAPTATQGAVQVAPSAPAPVIQPTRLAPAVPTPTPHPYTQPPMPPSTDPNASSATAGNQMRETRLGAPENYQHAAYPNAYPSGQSYSPMPPQPMPPMMMQAQPRGGKLGPLHFIGGALLLVVLVGAPLAYFTFGTATPKPAPVVNQPPLSPSVATEPTPPPSSPSLPAQQIPSPTGDASTAGLPDEGSQTDGEKDAKGRSASTSRRTPKPDDTAARDRERRRREARRLLDQ